jgi:desulfoferrodoxin (superoxide reductase-like protein)
MRKIRIVAAVMAAMVIGMIAAAAWANPPKDIVLSFDAKTNRLHVKAIHPTLDVKTHYIRYIKVVVDGKEMANQELKGQSSPEAQETDIELKDVKSGAQFEVTGTCNIQGSKTVQWKAP